GWELEKEYGKTEAWYVLEADPGTTLYYGLNKDMTKEEFRKAIEENKILDCLNKVPVKKGDVLFVASGTIHALCTGAVIIEVQQNSNTTYRIYDHGRLGADGKPRQLHIEKSILASNLNKFEYTLEPAGKPHEEHGATVTMIAECKYFKEELYEVHGEADVVMTEDSFRSIIVVKGEGTFTVDGEEVPFAQGESYFVPAEEGMIHVTGNVELVISRV
ncbi:MAG: class I mannose-6-phosphate isomerase, partial [Erysipelotrichaceae bacterium]|nr:class I mannose-6-phosphate isomerase [Erysipelotrichaceae bacterium]